MRSAILVMFFCRCLIAQDAAGIEGVATDAVTHQAMPGVHVTLRLIRGDEKYGAISGRDGHFSIRGMTPALYSLRAQRSGYIHMPVANMTLKPGENVTGLTVEMTPHAVIEGHVFDENGDPVQNVEVAAIPAVSGSPESKVAMVMSDRTDDRGHFRLALPPGKFQVTTQEARYSMRGDSLGPLVYGATLYPTPIEVAAGHNVTGIDIHLARTRGMTISGTITGMLENTESPWVVVLGPQFSVEWVAQANGKFAGRGLTPGHYRLVAKQQSEDTMVQSAPVDVEPVSGGEARVSLAMVRGGAVSGTLEIEGDPPKETATERLTVRLESSIQTRGAEAGPDGAFRIEPVFPEKLQVRVIPLPENAFIKSAELNGVEAKDGVIDLSGGVGEARIKVTLSRNGGQVEGSVISESPLAYVALAARVDDIDRDVIKAVAAGEKFRYKGLRPGKYRLMAIDPRKSSAHLEDFEALFPNAPEFEIGEGDRIVRDAKP
jgi:hypothetical protein